MGVKAGFLEWKSLKESGFTRFRALFHDQPVGYVDLSQTNYVSVWEKDGKKTS